MQLELFDAVGLGAGGSGAAAGLLHPFTPKGKVGHAMPASHTSHQHAALSYSCSALEQLLPELLPELLPK
jgi:hypothetical protein